MSVLQTFLIAVVLSTLGVVAGILSNWLPRPAGARNRWIVVGLAVVVTASAAVGLWQQGRVAGERSLREWASEVNTKCEAVTRSVGAAAHVVEEYFRRLGMQDAGSRADLGSRWPALIRYACCQSTHDEDACTPG